MRKVWTLKQAARRLGVTYISVWMNVKKGRLRTIRLSGRIHGIPDEELRRFESMRRPRGRPPKAATATQTERARRSPRGAISAYYRRLSSATRNILKRIRHFRLARVGLIPLREEFPEGPEGDSAWDAAIRQRLDDLKGWKSRGVTDYRNQALVLKLHNRSIPYALLDRALMSYVLPLAEFAGAVTDVTLKEAARKFARRPWSAHPGTKSMSRDERARAIEVLMKMFLEPVTQEETLLAFRAVGVDTTLLPEVSKLPPEGVISPGGGLPQRFHAMTRKIIELGRSCVTKREDGKYEVKAAWTHQEMDQAWDLARLILSQVPDNVRKDPKLSVRDHMANIAFTVIRCLILVKESGGQISDVGATIGAQLSMALMFSASASKEMKEMIRQIIDAMSRRPQSLPDLLHRLNSLSVMIEKSSMSPEEKAQVRKTLQFMRALATDPKKTGSQKYHEAMRFLREHLGLAPVE